MALERNPTEWEASAGGFSPGPVGMSAAAEMAVPTGLVVPVELAVMSALAEVVVVVVQEIMAFLCSQRLWDC